MNHGSFLTYDSYDMTHSNNFFVRSCKWVENFNEKHVERTQTQHHIIWFIFDFMVNLGITIETTLVPSISEWMSCWMRKNYENQKYYFQGFNGHPLITCQNGNSIQFKQIKNYRVVSDSKNFESRAKAENVMRIKTQRHIFSNLLFSITFFILYDRNKAESCDLLHLIRWPRNDSCQKCDKNHFELVDSRFMIMTWQKMIAGHEIRHFCQFWELEPWTWKIPG